MAETERPPFKEEQMRFSANIPKSLNDRLNKYLPWGLKGEVVRQLLYLLDERIVSPTGGLYSVTDLLEGNLKLVKRGK